MVLDLQITMKQLLYMKVEKVLKSWEQLSEMWTLSRSWTVSVRFTRRKHGLKTLLLKRKANYLWGMVNIEKFLAKAR